MKNPNNQIVKISKTEYLNIKLTAKREVFNDFQEAVLSKIRIDEDRYYFWKEVYNPLVKKHFK